MGHDAVRLFPLSRMEDRSGRLAEQTEALMRSGIDLGSRQYQIEALKQSVSAKIDRAAAICQEISVPATHPHCRAIDQVRFELQLEIGKLRKIFSNVGGL